MENLPLEMVKRIVRFVDDPKAIVSLSTSNPEFRNTLPSLSPLVLPIGYVLDWNTFVTSPYDGIQGEGSIQAPVGDLSKASRRLRGNFQLTLRPEVYKTNFKAPEYHPEVPLNAYIPYTEAYPNDILPLLYTRTLLYPSSRFLLRSPDNEVIVEWNNGTLTLNLEWKDWENADRIRAIFRSLPIHTLSVDTPDLARGLADDSVFSDLLNTYASDMEGVRTMVLPELVYPRLSSTVIRLEIPESDNPYEIGEDEDYSQVQELVIRGYKDESGTNDTKSLASTLDLLTVDINHLIDIGNLPNLKLLIYQLPDVLEDENLETLGEELERLRGNNRSFKMVVESSGSTRSTEKEQDK